MKSIKIFATVGAIALLGTTGFTSCNQKNGPEEPEKYLNNKTVKTEFVIKLTDNVSKQSNGTRYMPSATAQIGGRNDFDGMKNIILLPFQGEPAANNSNRAGKDITLANISSAAASTGAGKLNSEENIYYSDINIPLGTEYFLFYGQSGENAPTTAAGKFEHGRLVATGLGTLKSGENEGYATLGNSAPNSIHFDLEPITTNTSFDEATKLADIVTNIAKSKDGSDHNWSDDTNSEALKQLYSDFTNMKTGSSNAILAALEDLYNTLERQQSMLVSDDPVITAILAEIDKYVSASAPSGADKFDRTLSWKTSYQNSSSEIISIPSDYPTSKNLPDGAAIIKWNGTKFSPVTDGLGTNDDAGMLSTTALNKYTYPASLWYFANSAIGTATTSQAAHYDDLDDWSTILGRYTTTAGTKVKSNTKSVAIKDEINYGVGLLQIDLAMSSADLYDKDLNKFNNSDVADHLFWKGVLVGGQKQVDYQFKTNTAADVYTIYDNHINACATDGDNAGLKAISTSTSTNYTLVLGTEDNNNDAESKKVKIAIELVNKFGDFVGADGLIPTGGTFYLIAELDAYPTNPASAPTVGGTAPDDHNIFYKDTKTLVTLTIGAESLKHAYYTIPDLRSSSLELGFSVNLAWENGYTFTWEL